MSHLTLAGKRCKVAGKEYKCIFHRKSSRRVGTRISKREASGGQRRSSDPVPWYIAMSGPSKRRVQEALRREEAGEQLNFIPRWSGTRSGARTGRYGQPRNQYRSRAGRRSTRSSTRGNAGKIWSVIKTLMKEVTGVPFPGEPWR